MTATLAVIADGAPTLPVPSVCPPACPDGCCIVVVDLTITPVDWGASVNTIRPMFQVLYDDGSWKGEDFYPYSSDDPNGMRVPAYEYRRPDRIFL